MNKTIDYFRLSSPSLEVDQKVSFLKQWVREKLRHSYESEFFKAHITLTIFYGVRNDSKLYDVSDNILPAFKPFRIHIDGFDIFKHGTKRTIYLKIIFQNTVGELMKGVSGQDGVAHITVARNLVKEDFNKIWPHLQKEEYKNSFTCDAITVLQGNGGPWKHYTDLPLA